MACQTAFSLRQAKTAQGSLHDRKSKAQSAKNGVVKLGRKDNGRDKQTVTLAGVFKHSQKMIREKKNSKDGRKELNKSERDFAGLISNGFTEARRGIEYGRKNQLDQVRQALSQVLNNARAEDKRFLQIAKDEAETLTTSLVEEQIETQSTLNGKRMRQVVQMGPRTREFEKQICKESAKLRNAWKEWDQLQDEFLALGIEVFGTRAFPNDTEGMEQQGYKKQMELIALDHRTREGELTEEIETIGREAVQEMKSSEEDLAAAQKAEQIKLLEELFAD